MPKYMILFKAENSSWPTDPKQLLHLWEGIIAGGDQLFKTGLLKDVGWFSAQEGYAIFEAESKAKVLELVSSFFPFYNQQIHEIAPWERAKESLLASARRATSLA